MIVAGRDAQRASVVLDTRSGNLAAELRRLGATVVVHTAGPFQGQDYAVPRACIEARAHYVDLADARGYVCGIQSLDDEARSNDVLVVSGASSVPALSSAVVDQLRVQFSTIESIDHGITSGARPPGLAAMEGVLSYVGKPIAQWRDGAWRTYTDGRTSRVQTIRSPSVRDGSAIATCRISSCFRSATRR